VLKRTTGQLPTLTRPPYGASNPQVRSRAGRPLILWNVDTEDWKYRNRAHVVRATVSMVQPGDIVLMHDIHRTTVAAVPVMLRQLTARGYHFVTVSQLMKGSPMRAGRVYLSNPALR
jgi:peptidoglycan/xylan/chitin deacetylase (PgdA/CDA1 family)